MGVVAGMVATISFVTSILTDTWEIIEAVNAVGTLLVALVRYARVRQVGWRRAVKGDPQPLFIIVIAVVADDVENLDPAPQEPWQLSNPTMRFNLVPPEREKEIAALRLSGTQVGGDGWQCYYDKKEREARKWMVDVPASNNR